MKKIEPNQLSTETKASLRTRVITAIGLVVVCVPCLFLGGWFYFALSVFIALAGGYELVHVIGLKTRFKYLLYVASLILIIGFTYWIFIKNNLVAYRKNPDAFDASALLTNQFTDLLVSTVLILVAAGVFFGISFISEEFTVHRVFYLLSMIIIIGLCLQSMLYLRYSPTTMFKSANVDVTTSVFKYAQSSFLIIYVLLGTLMTDLGGYFVGIFFGKHKLNPRISPKKTWEGFAGGCITSFVVSAAWALILAACGYPILPTLSFDANYYGGFGWLWIILISVLMPIFANLGDFAFSAIKRGFNVKDFSNLLPGHGGVLDRFDSILFVSGFVATILIFINMGWNII